MTDTTTPDIDNEGHADQSPLLRLVASYPDPDLRSTTISLELYADVDEASDYAWLHALVVDTIVALRGFGRAEVDVANGSFAAAPAPGRPGDLPADRETWEYGNRKETV